MARPHRDRFDDIDDSAVRVGAHRTRRPARHRWGVFGIALLSAAILAVVGVYLLGVWDPQYAVIVPGSASTDSVSTRTDDAVAATEQPTGLSTGAASVTLLKQDSEPKSVVDSVTSKLTAKGWSVSATTPIATAPDSTRVYYSPSSMRGYALGIVKTLGYGSAVLSDEYSANGITIVLGSDAG